VLNLKGKIMYSKITHTIVEEHFGPVDFSDELENSSQPIAQPISSNTSDGITSQNPELFGLDAKVSNRRLDKDIM
jgi:hypothetical protein